MNYKRSLLRFATSLTLVLGLIGNQRSVDAAQLGLSWSDNSTNEDGFSIERSVGTTGAYLELASVGGNATTYQFTEVHNLVVSDPKLLENEPLFQCIRLVTH